MNRTIPDEPVGHIGPIDEDFDLLGEVIANTAAPQQLEEFARRYAADDAFRLKVGPVLTLFATPMDVEAVMKRADAIGEQEAFEVKLEAERRRERNTLSRRAPRWLMYAAAAAVLISVPGVILVSLFYKTPTTGSVERQSPAIIATLDAQGGSTVAPANATSIVTLPGGSRVLVRPGSSVRHAPVPDVAGGEYLEIRGEAAVEVAAGDAPVRVLSRAGLAVLEPGSYALRCVGACESLEVSVRRGLASLTRDVREAASFPVRAGEHGRAFRDRAPLGVPADSAKLFPQPDSTPRRDR